MDDDFPNMGKRKGRFPDLACARRRGRFEGVNGTKKIIFSILILVLGMRLFFYPELSEILNKLAENIISTNSIDRIESRLIQKALAAYDKTPELPNSDILDPMKKIGKSTLPEDPGSKKICKNDKQNKNDDKDKLNVGGVDIKKMLNGYPIFEMIEQVASKKKEVAAFLIGIAKKESDWGKYSPKKNGRNCYNYWGYKGNYNLTDSGYSCFDSPAQAIDIVGGKIEDLVGKNINTPEKMVVWKCGSSCAGHEPGSVRKWISDVAKYYYQLTS